MLIHPINIEAEVDLDIDYAKVNFHGKELFVDAKAHVVYGYVDYDETDWEFDWITINYVTDVEGVDVLLSGAEEAELVEILKQDTKQFENYVWSKIQDELH